MSDTIQCWPESNRASQPPTRSAAWRLVTLALALLAGLGMIAWIKSSIWQRVGKLEASFATIRSESFVLGLHARESLVQLNSSLLRYQLSGESVERDRFRTISQSLWERLRVNKPFLTTERERELVAALEESYQAYLGSATERLERPVRGVRKDSAAQAEGEINAESKQVLELAGQLVQAQQAAMGSFFSESEGALGSLQNLLSLSVGLLFLLLALVAALTYRALIAPLRLRLNQSQAVIERHEKLASLGVLAAGVAHEIRNPLTAIKFRLFSLRKSLPSDCRDHEDILVINSELNRLERIVKDFLQFARPSEPEWEVVPVLDVLRQIQKLLSDELGRRGIQLQVEEGPPISLRADRQQIQQVLINLVQNGAESIGRDGRITLRAREGATRRPNRMQPVVILEVADTGQGISAEAEKRLFDPFFSTKADGTGLGLPIAARILEKHGGFIQYATQAEKGTVFSVVLPRLSEPSCSSPANPIAPANESA